ncbi:MAG: class I SAM-dependent methyltransferase [Deltaproteobacteria bacterium]|nr:class I SAM-dependent methyltransferase [Deltaproteobacteria bacterium]
MIQTKPYESEAIRAVTGPAIRPGGLDLTRRAARYCRLKAGDRVLDVGCGTGVTTALLNREFQTRAVGVDLSVVLLTEARRCDPDLPVIRGNAVDLPLKADHYSTVFCECVLSLLPDPARALNEFCRVLRPGGHVVVADLYQRTAGSTDSGLTGRGCVKGAVSRDVSVQRMVAAGLVICLWEDHSDLLKVLAARLVWAGISLKDVWGKACSPAAGKEPFRPGYYLLVAGKGEQSHG